MSNTGENVLLIFATVFCFLAMLFLMGLPGPGMSGQCVVTTVDNKQEKRMNCQTFHATVSCDGISYGQFKTLECEK